MNFVTPDFLAALPELFVLSMACLVLVVDVYLDQSQRERTYQLSVLTMIGALLLTLPGVGGSTVVTFSGHFVRDLLGDTLKISLYLSTAMAFLYARDYLRDKDMFRGEFYVLGLFAVLGMQVMISSHSFLSVYLGLELLSLSLYALVAFNRDSLLASEAAMKYFVLGALASGMLLYGISMVYGATGSVDFSEIAKAVATARGQQNLVLTFGLVFLVVGLAFKLGVVPFHMWVPDVYQGAPTPVTLLVGSAPKLAAFALVMRVLVEGMPGLQQDWQQMLTILVVLSLAIGNLVAIAQTSIKRMLAYSTISHVGFLLLGVLAGNPSGYGSSLFYTVTYVLMVLGAFGVLLVLSRKGVDVDNLKDLYGLNERSPWLAFIMLLVMASMAGFPPLVGFYAKLAVIQAVVGAGLVPLAIFAVLMSVVGAFYYLRVVWFMYFEKPELQDFEAPRLDTQTILSANGLLVLALGIYPSALMTLCLAAVQP